MALSPGASPEIAAARRPSMLPCRWRGCSRVFDDASLLYAHLCEDHVGRKADGSLCLECRWDGCTVVTKKRDHATSHVKVHVELKPYACSACGKAFKRTHDLTKHIRTAHQSPPHLTATSSASPLSHKRKLPAVENDWALHHPLSQFVADVKRNKIAPDYDDHMSQRLDALERSMLQYPGIPLAQSQHDLHELSRFLSLLQQEMGEEYVDRAQLPSLAAPALLATQPASSSPDALSKQTLAHASLHYTSPMTPSTAHEHDMARDSPTLSEQATPALVSETDMALPMGGSSDQSMAAVAHALFPELPQDEAYTRMAYAVRLGQSWPSQEHASRLLADLPPAPALTDRRYYPPSAPPAEAFAAVPPRGGGEASSYLSHLPTFVRYQPDHAPPPPPPSKPLARNAIFLQPIVARPGRASSSRSMGHTARSLSATEGRPRSLSIDASVFKLVKSLFDWRRRSRDASPPRRRKPVVPDEHRGVVSPPAALCTPASSLSRSELALSRCYTAPSILGSAPPATTPPPTPLPCSLPQRASTMSTACRKRDSVVVDVDALVRDMARLHVCHRGRPHDAVPPRVRHHAFVSSLLKQVQAWLQ